ncbi:hypothetical protein MJK86_26420, partial [Salmonella enterica subsp. enterica serovar Kentucky]|nr:hypothetical protein [Salmonella enterica subsp. enterica serovar Kentucky]
LFQGKDATKNYTYSMVFSAIKLPIILYTLHTSSGLCVGYGLPGTSMGLALTGRCSPQSHRYLCSWGLTPLPPLSNSNYFGYIFHYDDYRSLSNHHNYK